MEPENSLPIPDIEDLDIREQHLKAFEYEYITGLELSRRVLTRDLHKFNINILGIEEGKDKVALGEVHKEIGVFIDNNKKRNKLLLIPRGHLKSTYVTVGRTLQAICDNPAVRVLIVNANYGLATAFLKEVKRHLQFNEKIKEFWGDLAKDPETWKEDQITLNQEKLDRGKKEATVTAKGLESSMTSQHYDIIIGDDLVNRDYVNTPDQIQKTIDVYKELLNLLEPGGELILIGTRWHDADLYGYILDKENNLLQDFDLFIRKSYEGDLHTGENFKALFPEKFKRKHLLNLYQKQGPYVFSCQYQNDPIPDSAAIFRSDWFRYYEPLDLRGVKLYTFTTVDPALSLERDSDYTAMVTVSIDEFNNIYIREIVRDKLTPSAINDHLFRINKQYNPISIGLENVAYQKVLHYSLNEEMRMRHEYLPMVELKPGHRNKESRIQGLQPLYANGKIFHAKVTAGIKYLEDELLRFPKSKNDDISDALAYGPDIWYPPKAKKRQSSQRSRSYLY